MNREREREREREQAKRQKDWLDGGLARFRFIGWEVYRFALAAKVREALYSISQHSRDLKFLLIGFCNPDCFRWPGKGSWKWYVNREPDGWGWYAIFQIVKMLNEVGSSRIMIVSRGGNRNFEMTYSTETYLTMMWSRPVQFCSMDPGERHSSSFGKFPMILLLYFSRLHQQCYNCNSIVMFRGSLFQHSLRELLRLCTVRIVWDACSCLYIIHLSDSDSPRKRNWIS